MIGHRIIPQAPPKKFREMVPARPGRPKPGIPLPTKCRKNEKNPVFDLVHDFGLLYTI